MSITPPPNRFHLAMPVHDLAAARAFYTGVLGCEEGRSSSTWVDFDLYGHQFVAHLRPNHRGAIGTNRVDGHDVPYPHYGIVLLVAEWRRLADRLRASGQEFIIEPYVRFAGEPGEQGTFFVADPSRNALEFKGLSTFEMLFATG